MEYDIRIGDYVETKDGMVGYVLRTTSWSDGTVDILFINQFTRTKERFWGTYREILQAFNRIGQYDFTKKDKVEHLLINKHVSMYCGNGETNSPSDYKRVFEQDELNDKMIDKINELVDAVNRLEEKVNN